MLYSIPIKDVGDVKVYCEPIFQYIARNLLFYCVANTAFKDVLNSIVNSYPDFSIAFENKELRSRGEWSVNSHQIKIKDNLTFNELIEVLAFECCNAVNPKLKNLTFKNFSNAEEYATAAVEAEYDTYKHCYGILESGIQSGTWHIEPKLTAFKSLKDWVEVAKKETNIFNGAKSHFDLYVNFFNRKKLANSHQNENNVKVTNSVRQQL